MQGSLMECKDNYSKHVVCLVRRNENYWSILVVGQKGIVSYSRTFNNLEAAEEAFCVVAMNYRR
jgi:hypothetical protein